MSDQLAQKSELLKKRAELIEAVSKAPNVKTRMNAQLALSEVNSTLKHINKIIAADEKLAADQRKSVGLLEAQVNEQRRQERQEGIPGSADRDEAIMVKAKQLQRELLHRADCPPHFPLFIDALRDFIYDHKAHMAGTVKTEPEREGWQKTWDKK